jgi:integron integrase
MNRKEEWAMDGNEMFMAVEDEFEGILARELGVPPYRRPFFKKWLFDFFEYCRVRELDSMDPSSADRFLEDMFTSGRRGFQVEQARIAIIVFREHFHSGPKPFPFQGSNLGASLLGPIAAPLATVTNDSAKTDGSGVGSSSGEVLRPAQAQQRASASNEASRHARLSRHASASSRAAADPAQAALAGPALESLEKGAVSGTASSTTSGFAEPDAAEFPGGWRMAFAGLGREIRLRHYSLKTFKSYHHWVRAFSRYVEEAPVGSLTSQKAGEFIAHLATERHVSAATQNQAFSALLFFYNRVLKRELEGLEKTPRATRRQDVPVVLTRREVQIVLAGLEYPYRLFAQLLYGCGLRLNEGLMLRVQDLDLQGGSVHVHNGKGAKSRTVPLPKALLGDLAKHLESVRGIFKSDVQAGFAGVFLPDALERKMVNASRSWLWQWVFPGGRLSVSEMDGKLRRFHLHESSVQKEIKAAAESGRLDKRVTAHTLRHSYATHLLQMGYDIRTVQDLMGHNDISTTMIYTHALQAVSGKVISPLDI